MAQFPVVSYWLEMSTAPRQRQAGVPPPEMRPAVYIQVPGTQLFALPIESKEEFLAVCALLQTPGRLVFEQDEQKLLKIMP